MTEHNGVDPRWCLVLATLYATVHGVQPSPRVQGSFSEESSLKLSKSYTKDFSGLTNDCDLCGKAPLSYDIQIKPEKYKSTYSLNMEHGGLFCCSETGIKFLVAAPVTIEYKLDSAGSNEYRLALSQHYMSQTQQQRYEIVGPIFNITRQSPGLVLAVHLPHYVCLKGENVNRSRFKIGHLMEDNMTLETATTIDPYYAVLENPYFSSLVVLYLLQSVPMTITNYIPTHGAVLIYYKCTDACMKIHLYLMPNDISVKEAIDRKEEKFTFCRIDKPPQTEVLYTKNTYNVIGPINAKIIPKHLKFQYYPATELYPFSEIVINKRESVIGLHIFHTNQNKKIWESELTEDVRHLFPPTQPPINTGSPNFVTNNFESLCSRIGLLQPILLALRAKGILNEEEEESIREQQLRVDKNKMLLEFIKRKNATRVFYEILKEKDPYLVADLEQSLRP